MSDSDNTDPIATQADLDAYFSQSSSVPQDRSTPMDADVAALNDQANKQIAAGVPEDQVIAQLQQGVQKAQDKHFGKKSDKVGGDDPIASAADIDAWFANKPTPSGTPSELEDDQPYRTPNYSPQVALSPVTREAPPDKGDVPSAIPELTQKARAADAAAEEPADTRRDVGFGENLWRQANAGAAGTLGLLKGAASAIGYPITAADAALSGQPVPSLSDVVSSAEAPNQAEKKAYELNPKTEKATLGGEIGGGIGGAAENLLEMAATGPGKAAASGAGLAEQLATKLLQTARVSSLPAAKAAQDAAQSAIDSGATPEDAATAALGAYNQTVAGNLLPVAAKGNVGVRAVTGAGIGAGQAALNGGDLQQTIAGAVTGAGMGVAGGEEAAPRESAADRSARRVREATDQILKNTETGNANEVPQDQGGVPEAGTEPQGGGEGRGENLQQPAKAGAGASDEGEQVNVDQNVQPDNASGAAPAAEAQKAFTPEERHAQKIEALLDKVPDLSDAQKQAMRDNMPGPSKDDVTGFYTRPELKPTIDAAKDSGQPSAYAEVDLRNLGGLNAAVGSNSGADAHFKAMADIVRQEAEKTGADIVPIRKGGDEMGIVFRGADANTAHEAMTNAQERIADYAEANGLNDIANPKGGDRGTGIHFGVSEIKPEHSTSDIIKSADTLVELRKKGEAYEYPRPTEEIGTGERAAGESGAGAETPSVRNTGENGLADDHEQATPIAGEGQRGDERPAAAVNERANESESVEKYRTGSESEGVTADEARQKLKSEFGATAVRKMEAAGLKITPSSELPKLAPELSPQQRAGVKGLTTKQGQPHLIHDQTGADEIHGTVVHEIWHANADKVLPKTKQEALARAVERVPGVRDALAKIPADTNAGHVAQEKVAYALQHLHDDSVGTRVMDAVKIGLNRLGVPKNWLDANEALIRRIGAENLKHFQETPRTFQDRGTERTEKPRIRVPVDQVPVNRVNSETSQVKENGESVTPQRVTSIKNAQVNKEREERGAELLSSIKGASNQKAMDDAKAVLDKDQDAGRRLTAELLNKPRPLNKTEVATMLRDRVRIHNELEDAYEAARTDPNNAGNIARIKDLEMQRDANDEADRRAGTENALGLQARAMMAAQDYSLVNMVKRLEVAKGEKLKPDEMEQVRKIADGIKAEKRVNNSPKEIADEFEALKNELAAISKKPEAQPSQAKFARAEPNVAKIIQRMAANRAAAGMPYEAAVKAIHEAVSPHADVSINDVRDAINEPKSARRQAFLGKKESDLVRRLKENDTSKGTRYKPVYNSDVNAAEGRVKALQQRFDAMKRRAEERNQSAAYKTGQIMHNTHLASILASLHVYPKLAGAVIAKYVGHGLEQATGAIAQNLPGLRAIASKADSQRVTLRGEGQYLKGIGMAGKDAWQTLRRGYSDLDAKYGGKDTITDEYTDYAESLFGGMGKDIASGRLLDAGRTLTGGIARFEGRTHGMIKSFASTPKFYESYANIASKMRDDMKAQGMSDNEIQEYMSRRSTDMEIGSKAYLNALEDKMQGKNALADGINRMLVGWDQSGNAGLRGLSLLFQTVFPIRKIPLNIAKEGTSYLFGGLKAATSIAKNYAEARANGESFLDHMSGDRADYIMKNIKKQGAGAALFALGYILGPQVLGGVPQAGDKKKHLAVTPGEAEINGVQVGDSAFHSAAAQILQLGAGYRRAYESYYGKSDNAAQAGLEAFADQYGSQFVRQVPYLDQPRRWMQTAEYAPRDKRSALSEIAGNQIRSMVIPGIVQQYARSSDEDQRWPKPRNIMEDIETGIPGHGFLGIPGREDVPHH